VGYRLAPLGESGRPSRSAPDNPDYWQISGALEDDEGEDFPKFYPRQDLPRLLERASGYMRALGESLGSDYPQALGEANDSDALRNAMREIVGWCSKQENRQAGPLTQHEAYPRLVQSDCHVSRRETPPSEPVSGSASTLGPGVTSPQDGSLYQFQRKGKYWQVRFEEESGLLGNLIGLECIARLIARPNEEIPFLALKHAVQPPEQSLPAHELDPRSSKKEIEGVPRGRKPLASGDEVATDNSSRQEIVDSDAIRDYKQRLHEIEAELKVAIRQNDLSNKNALSEEKAFIEQELRKVKGLGGKSREFGSPPSEKARTSIRNAFKRAYADLRSQTPPLLALADHLESSIVAEGNRTYSYHPSSPAPNWTF
jgi:hypothetical protein